MKQGAPMLPSNRFEELVLGTPISELLEELKLRCKMSNTDWKLFEAFEDGCHPEIFRYTCGTLVPVLSIQFRRSIFVTTPDQVVHWLKVPVDELVKYLGNNDPFMQLIFRYRLEEVL